MDEGDVNQPPPPPLPPEPPEIRLETSIRTIAEVIERLATLQEIQMRGGGGLPAREEAVVEVVRASKDPSVIKPLNDNNYTALKTGWVLSPATTGPTTTKGAANGFPRLPLMLMLRSNHSRI